MSIKRHSQRMQYQSGNFLIEFALIASFMAMCMMFVTDMTIKQTIQGNLQRLSYSAVNVIKERTQLYNDSEVVSNQQVAQIYTLVSQSMERTMGDFDEDKLGMYLEQVRFQKVDGKDKPVLNNEPRSRGDVNCRPTRLLDDMDELFIDTSWGRKATLYRVSLCYEDDDRLSDFLGSEFTTVRANFIMLGR
ncbi:tight adherence pilus pseudopilin TadF [Endozoicomonadaceae bacterium StTr2]